jgi:hypothetical protein
MTRWILALGLASVITACATPPGQPTAAQSGASAKTSQIASNSKPEKDSDMICTTGMEIGSHIPQRTCYTRKEAERRKKAAQQAVQNMTSGPSSGSSNCSPSC